MTSADACLKMFLPAPCMRVSECCMANMPCWQATAGASTQAAGMLLPGSAQPRLRAIIRPIDAWPTCTSRRQFKIDCCNTRQHSRGGGGLMMPFSIRSMTCATHPCCSQPRAVREIAAFTTPRSAGLHAARGDAVSGGLTANEATCTKVSAAQVSVE